MSFAMTKPAVAANGLKLHRIDNSVKFQAASLPVNTDRKQAVPPLGTTRAITYLRIGGAADSTLTKPLRGGARNRRGRQSDRLTPRQIGELIGAARHASVIGLPLNRMITVHWEKAGISRLSIARANGHFLDLLSKAIARYDGKTAHIWVQESGERKGGHCHILTHVPAELVEPVSRLQRGWLRSITGQPYRRTVIHSDPIGGWLGLEASNPPLHATNLAAALSYVLKGADEEAAPTFGLRRLEAGGCCFGKRCGWSQNIGAKARNHKGVTNAQS